MMLAGPRNDDRSAYCGSDVGQTRVVANQHVAAGERRGYVWQIERSQHTMRHAAVGNERLEGCGIARRAKELHQRAVPPGELVGYGAKSFDRPLPHRRGRRCVDGNARSTARIRR